MYAAIAVIVLVMICIGIVWYNGKTQAENAVDAEAKSAEAKQAQEARTHLEEQRSRDNESARQRDVREATEAVAGHRVDDFLRNSFEDDPRSN